MLVSEIPGVAYSPWGDGVVCNWDAVPIVSDYVDRPLSPGRYAPVEELPGYADYKALIAERPPRHYQSQDATRLANLAYGFLCNPMRSGKTFTILLAALLAGCKRILVVCPSIAQWVWGDEAYKWLGREALILTGTSNSRALRYCGRCLLSGRLPDGSRCPDCRQRNGSTYGYRIFDVRETEPPTVTVTKQGGVLGRCRKHPDVWSPTSKPIRCPRCRAELREVLTTAEIVVASRDILSGRGFRRLSGKVMKRDDLPGWGGALACLDFDLAVVDESHSLRAFDTSEKRRGKMPADRVKAIFEGIPRCWLVTGTPIFGRVRDLYGQLDVATGGTVDDGIEWTTKYCAGHSGVYGWEADGSTNEEELKRRLDTIMIKRPRSEILAEMPPKSRRVVYIDNDKPVRRKLSGSPVQDVYTLIDSIAPRKHATVIEHVLPELAEGMKTLVVTFRPKHCERLAKKLQEEMNKKAWRDRMNEVGAEVFLAQTAKGIAPKRRREIAKAFREHAGAAVMVGSMRTLGQGSISTEGNMTVHMVDFDPEPAYMEQAEDRGYEVGVVGYSINHYVMRHSIDDDLASVVLPKFRLKDRMLQDENSAHVLEAFASENEVCAVVMERHTAHLSDADDEDDDWM